MNAGSFTVLQAALVGLGAGVALAIPAWIASVIRRDASIVDTFWSWFIWLPPAIVALLVPSGSRAPILIAIVALWAIRLSGHIAWRSRGQPEDHRYQAIRQRNQPGFAWKSLYLVFGLQAVLGWIVSWPLIAAVASPAPWGMLDALGLALLVFGLVFEAIADTQLARFRADPSRRGRVLDQGLWRYSRHPNYFGECCVWWGAWLVAASAGAWWSVLSPLLMTVLLLRVSGVALLEKDIGERRPAYAEYIRRTNAFFPGRPAQ
ncbi:MAG: DUF1295 domain-containing protein [Burkholderiaceae bacterium]|nr:DUF1295 domain-containing protein [Burkholderiaceae bacterium]